MNKYQVQAFSYALPTARNPHYLFCGLAGEAGEVLGLAAKQIRDEMDMEVFKKELKKELGDTLWFVASLAALYGMSLQEVADGNLDKLASRAARGVLKGSGNDR